MVQSVIEDLVNDILVGLIVALLGGMAVLLFVYIPRRRSKAKFFGIIKENDGYDVYVSRLMIKPGGTKAFEEITRGYFGPGIIKIEYIGAMLFYDALKSEVLATLPKDIQEWLEQRSVTMKNIEPKIDVSPDKEHDISSRNLFLIGSGIYNLASKIYLDHPSSHFAFFRKDDGARAVKFRKGGLKDQEILGREAGRELGIIQRINEYSPRRTVFVCAGVGASASYGSARYLVENWKSIRSTYEEDDFAMCLGFDIADQNSDIAVDPEIVFRT